MEDFDNYFTIEVNGEKGWEVIWSCFDPLDAFNRFRHYCEVSGDQLRLTTPKER